MIRILFTTVLAAALLLPGTAHSTDIPFIQVGGITVSLGDSAGRVREAFGEPEWEETQKDIRVQRRHRVIVRDVNVWWYTLDTGWGRPKNYGFYILEGELVRIRRTGW